jgi:hypothetical protein
MPTQFRSTLILAAALTLTACSGIRLSMARSAVSNQTGCPESKLSVEDTPEGWYATGCDTRYLCQVASGPCSENPTEAQRLARARAVFAKETSCPLPDVLVTSRPQGYAAQGCGRYSVCSSYDGPCMPSRPPTCQEFARENYDTCVAASRSDGTAGRSPRYASNDWATARAITGAVSSTIQANRLLEECRQHYETETNLCSK